jgi:hypothetical protein
VVPEETGLAEFLNSFERLRDPSHVRCLAVSEWTDLLTRVGLAVAEQELRRKHLDFPDWVRRTAESEQQVAAVEERLRSAPAAVRAYLEVEGERPARFSMVEWLALGVKAGDR